MNYATIKHFDIANGKGVRTSLFVSGCQFYCKNCFNLEAQNYNYGRLYTKETEKHILDSLKPNYIKGLSILGGDPLWQNKEDIEQLISLVNKTKSMGKDIWIWSGFIWENLSPTQHKLVDLCDVFVDGKYVDELRDLTLKWRGSSNQRVIDVQKTIKEGKVYEICN